MSVEMDGSPEEWMNAPIGELCTLNNGRAFKPTEWTTVGLPIVRIQNLNNPEAKFNYFSGDSDERYSLSGGELLFAWSGTPGTSFGAHIWQGGAAVLNQHIFRVDFSQSNLNKTYFRYAINHRLDELIGVAHGGVGLRHVTKGTFENTSIVLPPLAEQKVIADRLDALLAQVDTLKARLDAIPAILKHFRQSVLSAAVTGKLTEALRIQDQNWKMWRIEELAAPQKSSLAIGPFGSNLKVSDYRDEGHPLVFVREIRARIFGDEKTKFVNESKFHELAAHRVSGGDLLITKMGDPPGDVAIYPKSSPDAVITSDCVKFTANESLALTKCLFFIFQSEEFRSQILEISAGVAQQKISLTKFREIQIKLPPLPVQTEIVRRVESLFAFADQIEARVQEATARVKHLTQSILAKAFRGELTEEWRKAHPELVSGENSAEALLERIRATRAEAPEAKGKRGRKAQHSPSEATAPAITSWRGDSVAKLVGEDFSPSRSTPKKRGRPRKG